MNREEMKSHVFNLGIDEGFDFTRYWIEMDLRYGVQRKVLLDSEVFVVGCYGAEIATITEVDHSLQEVVNFIYDFMGDYNELVFEGYHEA